MPFPLPMTTRNHVSTNSLAGSPQSRYDQELAAGILQPDPRQAEAVAAFENLHRVLKKNARARFRLFSRPKSVPKGLYLYGSVGRGKTHLMDLFYDTVPGQRKQRWHYHDFMRWLHAQLRQQKDSQNPMARVIERLGKRIDLLCLDEFLVNDIADAMLLAGLLEHLAANGITLVTTSNVEPDQLYAGGLQRARFLPAIEWLKQNTQVIHLDGGTDFRYQQAGHQREDVGDQRHGQHTERQKWFYPNDDRARGCLKNWFHALGGTLPAAQPAPLPLNGHWLPIVAHHETVLWTDFTALCAENRHSNDYLELASGHRVLLVSDIPMMTDENNDAARRFITLVDVLYDRGTALIASAETHFSTIYQGQRLAFEFKRTVSRLHEMQRLPVAIDASH